MFMLGLIVGLLIALIIVVTLFHVHVDLPPLSKVRPKKGKSKGSIIEPQVEVNEIYDKFFRE